MEGTDLMFCLQRLISFRRMKTLNASVEDIAVAARGVDMLEVYPCSAHNHNASLHFRPQYIRSPMCMAHITTSNHRCLRFLDPGLIQTDRVFFIGTCEETNRSVRMVKKFADWFPFRPKTKFWTGQSMPNHSSSTPWERLVQCQANLESQGDAACGNHMTASSQLRHQC